MYPIYPVKYLILDKFDNLSKINNLYSPLLVLHGKNDEVVPFKMGQIIFNKYQNIKMKSKSIRIMVVLVFQRVPASCRN